jgi:hypothetical protein
LTLGLRLQVRQYAADALVQGLAAVALEQAASNPFQDSSERTSVPSSLGCKRNTWTALMPMVVPVQPSSWGGSTTWRVEVMELGPAFHRNTVPGWTRPWSWTDLTSGFHDGH